MAGATAPASTPEDLKLLEEASRVTLTLTEAGDAIRVEGLDGVGREVARRSLARMLRRPGLRGTALTAAAAEVTAEVEREIAGVWAAWFRRAQARAGAPGDRQAGRAAQFPHELLAEPVGALRGSRLPVRHAGRRARARRQAGPSRGAAARHRQGPDPRARRLARGHRRRLRPALRRERARRERHRRPPHRRAIRQRLRAPGRRGRRDVGWSSRVAPPDRGQPHGQAGGDRTHRPQLPGRGRGLRRAGWPRGAGLRRGTAGERRGRRQARGGHRGGHLRAR